MLLQPLYNATLPCSRLGGDARQPAVVFRNARPFLEERAPVRGVPLFGIVARWSCRFGDNLSHCP